VFYVLVRRLAERRGGDAHDRPAQPAEVTSHA
jgi:hypothetical protein